MSSALRSPFVKHRVSLASTVVRTILERSNLDRVYKIGPENFGRFGPPTGYNIDGNSEGAHFGGFELHDKKGSRVGIVFVPDLGKPTITVKKGHEPLGRNIASALKKQASYWFSPSVKVKSEIVPFRNPEPDLYNP